MKKKPNILLITTDQQRWDAIGFNNPQVKTPNLDALAKKGIVFEKSYTCSPVCTPARVSILTGHYPSRHGSYTIGVEFPDNYPTIPKKLGENGYFTSLIGKAHFHPCCLEGSFEYMPNIGNRAFFKNWTGPYHGFDYVKLVIGHTTEDRVPQMHYGLWLEENGVNPADYFGNNHYTDIGTWNIPEKLHPSTWTANETIEAIDRGVDSDKPFFLWSSFQDPHNPLFVPEPWASMYDPADMPLYEYKEGEHDNRPAFYNDTLNHKLGENPMEHGHGASLPFKKNWITAARLPFMEPEDKTRKALALYYGMVSFMDDQVGRIIRHLEEKDLMDNTIIVFTTDHGDYMGEHGYWWKGLPAFDAAQKVPFMVYDPACKTPGARSEAIQSLVDFGASFLSIAGIERPAGIQGFDQSDTWKDAAVKARDGAIIELRPTEDSFMQKTFVEAKYKLVLYTKTEWGELYDMESDPCQYKNLWDHPDYQSVKCNLMQRLIADEMLEDKPKERLMWA
ncbi:MAG: sulfatase-like hydrolase/transferase [Kiritimatiellaceae bacterium]|nr:sulfatase-like hydrolase/transferase [Kiritimatiellaceae bacterium]